METQLSFLSSDHKTNIPYYIYKPKNKPQAIIQISHGVCEYFQRYMPLIQFFNDHDILVCGHDHLGHGTNAEMLGYISPDNSHNHLVNDVYKLNKLIKKEYPNIPYILIGHSMGSFVVREYLITYPNTIDGVVIVGTSGKNPLNKVGLSLTNIIEKIYGDKHKSKLLNKLVFGAYNKKFGNKDFAWLTRDANVYNEYKQNKLNNFTLTVNGYYTLLKLLDHVSSKQWFSSVPKDLPIYIISGQEDPVGNYGKGVTSVFNQMKQQKCRVEMKLYEGARHEIFNEINKEEVFHDVLTWILKKKNKITIIGYFVFFHQFALRLPHVQLYM